MIYKAFLNRQEITGFPVKGKETSEIWGGDTLLWKKSGGIRKNIVDYAAIDKCTTTTGATLVNLIYGFKGTGGAISNKFAFFVGGNSIVKIIYDFSNIMQNEAGFAVAYKNYFYILHTDGLFENIKDFYKYSDKGELIFHYSNSDKVEKMFFQGFYVGDDDTFYCIFYNQLSSSYMPSPDTSVSPTVYEYKSGKNVGSRKIEKLYCKSASTDYVSNQYKISGKIFLESNRFLTPHYEYPFIQTLLEVGTDKLSLFTIEDTFNSRYYTSYASLGEYKGSIYLTGRYDYNSYGSFVCKYDGENYSPVYAAWEDTNASLDWRNWAMRIQTPCAFYANNMYFISNPDSNNSKYPYGVYKLNLTTRGTPKLIYELSRSEKITRTFYGKLEASYTFARAICLTIANNKLYVHKQFNVDKYSSDVYSLVYSIDEVPL
jgi:hypothetical protein